MNIIELSLYYAIVSARYNRYKSILYGQAHKESVSLGSYARNNAGKESDLDILVELDHTYSIGMKFFLFQAELEDLMKRKVDLVSEEGISKYVKPFIDKDKILIYERTAN